MDEVVVAWDPGLRESGAAVFRDGRLDEAFAIYADTGRRGAVQWVAMANTVAQRLRGVGATRFVAEQMSTRDGMEAADANLIELSIITGMVAALMRPAQFQVAPANVWTMGRKKAQNAAIVRQLLDKAELKVLKAALKGTNKTNHKELYDAVGIGLFALKRWQ